MDSNKVFENKDSEISKIFDYINNTLEDKKVDIKEQEEKEEEPDYELPESEEISTSLGSLFKNLKL